MGVFLSLEEMWALARPWYDGRMSAEYRGRSAEESEEIFRSVGLEGDFWRMRRDEGET